MISKISSLSKIFQPYVCIYIYMPVFVSTRGFQKYSLFFEPPLVAPQIERRSSALLGFRRTFRRAFPAKPSRFSINHHHHKVDLVVLYTVVYPFYRIHHRLTVFLFVFLFLNPLPFDYFPIVFVFPVVFRRAHPWPTPFSLSSRGSFLCSRPSTTAV